MLWIFFSLLFVGGAALFPNRRSDGNRNSVPISPIQRTIGRGICCALAFFCVAATSYVYIGDKEVGHLSRIYGGQLPAGHIIAFNGQKGPQAEVLGPGFNFRFLLNVLYKVEKRDVTTISAGKYGKLVARDGVPLGPGQAFADQFSPDISEMLDATEFLTKGGQKGPQIFVLTPGEWRINLYLWSVVEDDDTDIPKGFVGVVKSNVRAAVNFGDMKAASPTNCEPTTDKDLSGGKLSVPLVPIGCIGIWDRSVLPGRLYLNKDVYTVILVDTRVQAWEFKGGFERRTIALEVDQQGKIKQTESKSIEEVKDTYADRAVFLKVEGWDVPQELRVLVQITPDNAPIVVASVGGEKEVEHRIIVPVVRSIVRDVTGGGFMEFPEMDPKTGQIIMINRAPRVLDLLNNRSALEAKILETMKPEGQKAGVEIKEVRFGDPSVPPELLVARLREQLAQQLSASYKQEKLAQDERIKSENARTTADQQGDLVKSQIEFQRAQQTKQSEQLLGEGQEAKLKAIAEGQKAQTAVLGAEKVVQLRQYEILIERMFNLMEKNPEIVVKALENAGKLVPDTVITTGGGSGSISDAAAIFGTLFGNKQEKAVPKTN